MPRAKKKPARTRGPNIGSLATSLGFKSLDLSKRLYDFRLSKYSNEDFSTCTKEQLDGLTNEFLRQNGNQLWNRQISSWPVYPEHEIFLRTTIFEIYKRQRRNVIDMQAKRRRKDNSNPSFEEDSEPEPLDVSDEDSDDERGRLSVSVNPTTSDEHTTMSSDQMLPEQDVCETGTSRNPIDPALLRDLYFEPPSTRRSRKRTYDTMVDDASLDMQDDEPMIQDQQHSSNTTMTKNHTSQTSSCEDLGSRANNHAAGSLACHAAGITEAPTPVPPNQEQDLHETKFDFYTHPSYIEIIPENDTLVETSPPEQALVSRSVSTQTLAATYTSATSQTPATSTHSSGTQTLGAGMKSQLTQTAPTEHQSVSTQTGPVDSSTKTYSYDTGSWLISGDCDSVFPLLTMILEMIATEMKTARLKIRQAKTDAEREHEQKSASRLKQMNERIQQEITVLGFQIVSTDSL